MSQTILHDPYSKQLLRALWSMMLGGHALLSARKTRQGKKPCVYFGGARPGNIGGPLVKVKRLQEHFPESRWHYNLIYTLSNTPYLPLFALKYFHRQGVPIVHNQNGVFYPAWFAGDWQARNDVMARSYHMADHVFYQSEFCKIATDKFLGERSGSGEILYNAIDTNRFIPKSKNNIIDQPFRFLITGKIGNHLYYRLESTIQGLARARAEGLDADLEIAGWVATEAQKMANSLAGELGIQDHVIFTGAYTQEQAPDIYGQADAYVMTKHNDPCPNTVLEALSCGLPVLYSNTGGVPELVGNAGVALACENSWDEPKVPGITDIAMGMISIAEHEAEQSICARKRAVEKFDMSDWIGRHGEVFHQLLSGRH